jgi:hypothetical protein
MILDMLNALIPTLQKCVAETTYMVEKACHFEFASCLQLKNFPIAATMFALQVCLEVILPEKWVGSTEHTSSLVGLLAFPDLIRKVNALDMLRPPFSCKRSAAIWTWVFS